MRKFKYAFKSGDKQELRMQEVMGGAREDHSANDDDKQFIPLKSLFDKSSGMVATKRSPRRL